MFHDLTLKMVNGSYVGFDDDSIRLSARIHTIIRREIGNLNPHIPYISWRMIDRTDLILDTQLTGTYCQVRLYDDDEVA